MRYTFKDLSIDTAGRTVHRDHALLKLPDLSFDVLSKLIEAAPDTVSADEFSRTVWQKHYISDDTIAQRIALLRKVLGDNPKSPTYIRTVRGAGYALTAPVVLVEPHAPQTSVSIGRRGAWFGAACVALAFLVVMLVPNPRNTATEPTIKRTTPRPGTGITTLIERARSQLSLHQATETNRAIAMLREALTQDPDNFDARLTLSFALTTRSTKFDGTEDEEREAESIARSLLLERPDSSNAWSALGYALDAQGRSNESLPAYQTAYEIDPRNASALSSAAYTNMILGDLFQALTLEVRARHSGRTSRYSEIQIATLTELIDHPSAADWRAKALSLNPGQVVVLSSIARSHLRRGDPHAAVEVLDQANSDDKTAPPVLQLRGRAALALGDLAEARVHFLRAGERGSLDLAALDALSGNVTGAEKTLQHKLGQLRNSTWPGFRVHLAEISHALGKTEEALSLIKEAVNLGWRDLLWLKRSPFLEVTMQSEAGQQIEDRINRELEAQRRLIMNTEQLALFLDENSAS
ncbi:MAG: winged helix-turn-helix domain-containing protein [Gammaproteobacteria bacterium]